MSISDKKTYTAKLTPLKDKLVLHSDPKQVVKVETFLERINKTLRLDDVRFNKILVATTEAVNNGIIHGNQRNPEKKVVLIIEVEDRTITITVEDEGPGVDPDKLPDPLASENLLRENGRGVFLMRTMMHEVIFTRKEHGSAVIMKMSMG